MRFLIVVLLLLATITPASAQELTAAALNQYCNESDKAAFTNNFDQSLAQQCKGYIAGFFDSVIILEKAKGKKAFCMPGALPKTQASLILNGWVHKNRSIASKTTAAVALYAAFRTAYPC